MGEAVPGITSETAELGVCTPSPMREQVWKFSFTNLLLTGYLFIRKAVFGQISPSDAHLPPSSRPPQAPNVWCRSLRIFRSKRALGLEGCRLLLCLDSFSPVTVIHYDCPEVNPGALTRQGVSELGIVPPLLFVGLTPSSAPQCIPLSHVLHTGSVSLGLTHYL